MMRRMPKERDITACKTCATAKVRCETEPGQEKCRRCRRLGKVCESQAPGAHKKTPTVGTRKWSRADLLRLESKVDSVSHLLSVAPQIPVPGLSSGPTSTHPSASPPSLQWPLLPTGVEAVRLLDFYRAEMVAVCPFVPIPASTTQEALQFQSPLLHLAIMIVASQHDPQAQLELARLMRQEISQRVLIRNEKSIGALQAIVVYLSWNHVHHQLGHQLFNFVHIMISMAFELELNKEPNSKGKTAPGAVSSLGGPPCEHERTLDERRAYLGVYYISSIVKTYLKELEGVRFTKYADTCCQVLDTTMSPEDSFLVRLVRMQHQADKISRVLYGDDLESWTGMAAPTSLAIMSLEKEVRQFETLSRTDESHATLLSMAYQMLKVQLYKASLDDRLFPDPKPTASANTMPNFAFDPQRIHLLESCLLAIKHLTASLFSLPPETVLSLAYLTWGPIGHMMLTLSRLSDIHYGAWNPSYVSSILDFKATSRRLVTKLKEAMNSGNAMVPPRYFPDLFILMMNRFKELGGSAEDESEGVVAGAELGSGDVMWDDWTINSVFPDLFDGGT